MTVSPTATQALLAPTTDEAFLFLCQINHSSLTEPIRVVNNWEDCVSNGDTYIKFSFRVTLPDDSADNMPRPTLEIDNVDRAIYDAVRAMDSPATVSISIVMASTPDVIEMGPLVFTMRRVESDATTVKGELALEELWAEPFPGDSFNPSNYPGLF